MNADHATCLTEHFANVLASCLRAMGSKVRSIHGGSADDPMTGA